MPRFVFTMNFFSLFFLYSTLCHHVLAHVRAHVVLRRPFSLRSGKEETTNQLSRRASRHHHELYFCYHDTRKEILQVSDMSWVVSPPSPPLCTVGCYMRAVEHLRLFNSLLSGFIFLWSKGHWGPYLSICLFVYVIFFVVLCFCAFVIMGDRDGFPPVH